MDTAELSIHLQEKEVPRVEVKKFRGFSTVNIIVPGDLGISFFIESPKDRVNFKNNLIWTTENPEDLS